MSVERIATRFLKDVSLLAQVRMQCNDDSLGDVEAYMHPLYPLYALASIGKNENKNFLQSFANALTPGKKAKMIDSSFVEKDGFVISIQSFTFEKDFDGYIERSYRFAKISESIGSGYVLPFSIEITRGGVRVPRMLPSDTSDEKWKELAQFVTSEKDLKNLYLFFSDPAYEKYVAGNFGEYDEIIIIQENTREKLISLLQKTRHLWSRVPSLDDLAKRSAHMSREGRGNEEEYSEETSENMPAPLEFISTMIGIENNSYDMSSLLGKNTDSVFWLNKILYGAGVKVAEKTPCRNHNV